MAGDWIKVERATLKKPEILFAAELLGIERRECVGLFMDYFAWLDENLGESRNGFVTLMSRKSFDTTFACTGFAHVLEQIGWAKFDDDKRTLHVINHDRHNGKSAKSRALNKDRQSRLRNAGVTQHATPEKRREESTTPLPPNARTAQLALIGTRFGEFWDAWPKSQRKVDRKKCAERWHKDRLDGIAEQILAHVTAMSKSRQWLSGYDPAPLRYLANQRWQDPLPPEVIKEAPRLAL